MRCWTRPHRILAIGTSWRRNSRRVRCVTLLSVERRHPTSLSLPIAFVDHHVIFSQIIECQKRSIMGQSTHPVICRLSPSQLHALHMGKHYKLRRSSIGWWPYNHPTQGVSKLVRIIRPATIKSLWKMGLLDGSYDKRTGVGSEALELWSKEGGRRRIDG